MKPIDFWTLAQWCSINCTTTSINRRIYSEKHRHTETGKQTEIDKQEHRQIQTGRQTDRQTKTDRHKGETEGTDKQRANKTKQANTTDLNSLPGPFSILGVVCISPHVEVCLDDLWSQNVISLIATDTNSFMRSFKPEGFWANTSS